MRRKNRESTIELIESRIVLSVNYGSLTSSAMTSEASSSDVQLNLPSPEIVRSSSVTEAHTSEMAYIAADNSFDTARNLGILDGPRSLTDEYVGRFDDRDVFRFELPTAGSVAIELYDLSADADLFLLDASGAFVASSQNSENTSDSVQSQLQAGEYFVVVDNFNRWTWTMYSLDISANHDETPDLAGNSFATALDIGVLGTPQTFADYVGTSDPADVFLLELESPSRVQIDLTSLGDDIDLYLYSHAQELVAESNAEHASDERIDGWLTAGSYYVAVIPYAAANSDYTLSLMTVVEESQPEPPDEPNEPTPDPGGPPSDSPSQSPPDGPLAEVPYFGGNREWAINAVNAPEAWNAGYTGQGVTVAVIDTGFQLDHADLQNAFWFNPHETMNDGLDNDGNGFVDDLFGWDFVSGDADPTTTVNGHATHVAGIVAARENGFGGTGIAYGAQIMPIRVLDDLGSGSTYHVAQGIRYAVDNGADIINLSLGGENSATIHSALRYAEANDVFVVVASSNEGAAVPSYPARHSATLPNVLSVGAHDNSNLLASFSNRVGGSGAVQVDAPGVTIYNTLIDDSYGYLSGTSMATPHVAGIAALTLSANPNLTASQLRDVLVQGATVEIFGSDSVGGVDAAESIFLALGYESVGSASVSNTVEVTAGGGRNSVNAQRQYMRSLDYILAKLQVDQEERRLRADDFEDVDANTLSILAVQNDTQSHQDVFADEEFAATLELTSVDGSDRSS